MQFGLGQPVPRTEDPRLLTGNGHYVDDFNQMHQAYAMVLRSPHAHADITAIDKSIAGTDRSVSFKDVVVSAFNPAQLPDGIEPGLYEIATYNPKKANFPNSCHICELEIAPDTGEVEIIAYTVVDDVGFEINPLLVQGRSMARWPRGLDKQ